MERWKKIRDFPKYSISDYGRVRYDRVGRILAESENQYGVVCIGLMRDGQQFHRSVSLLVAKAFIPLHREAHDTPINIDGDRHNNHVDNLVWRPRWFAVKYNRQFRIPSEYSIDQPIQDVHTGVIWDNSFDCAKANGLLEKDIVLSIYNRTVVWPTNQQFWILD